VGNDEKPPVDKALDVLVYGPVGLALYVRDTLPTFFKVFVARGKTEVDQRRRKVTDQVGQARSMGEFAVGYGGPKVKARVEDGLREARQFAEQAFAGLVVPADEDDGASTAGAPAANGATDRAERAPATAAPSDAADDPASDDTAATLAIPDYDGLAASQVVERLEGLAPNELDAVREYETEHRGRRTILFKIDQLTT
jgi:hypothetical protein